MRLHRLALCLVLVACGSSKPAAKSPAADSAELVVPSGAGAPAEGAAPAAEPIEATKAEPAMAPGAPAPVMTAPPPPASTKRGATVKSKRAEDPDAGGE